MQELKQNKLVGSFATKDGIATNGRHSPNSCRSSQQTSSLNMNGWMQISPLWDEKRYSDSYSGN